MALRCQDKCKPYHYQKKKKKKKRRKIIFNNILHRGSWFCSFLTLTFFILQRGSQVQEYNSNLKVEK